MVLQPQSAWPQDKTLDQKAALKTLRVSIVSVSDMSYSLTVLHIINSFKAFEGILATGFISIVAAVCGPEQKCWSYHAPRCKPRSTERYEASFKDSVFP